MTKNHKRIIYSLVIYIKEIEHLTCQHIVTNDMSQSDGKKTMISLIIQKQKLVKQKTYMKIYMYHKIKMKP